ncbi:MAG TPA: phosphotransferase [Acidimicrobiales bacterium]|nr:phosphotransferase [Acidimicrobiales bacterium]
MPSIADTPDSLTPAWLSAALAETLGDVKVESVDTAPVGTGQMCDTFRLILTYAPGPDIRTDPPRSIIAKLPSADPISRATALSLGSYENEVRFYQQLAPRLDVRTPRVYYADIEVETASFVLLLEDLSPAQPGDQLAGCSHADAVTAIDELVGLHAPLWDDPSLKELPWLHRDRSGQQLFYLGLLPQLWDGFRERYAESLGPEVHEAGDQLFAKLSDFILGDTEPWTVVHGDYRLDNLLFAGSPAVSGSKPGEGTGASVTVLDWQTVTHGPALADVAYFIGAGLLLDDRRAHEGGLVRLYHDRLVAAGVQGYGWDRCWHDYRRGTWSGLIMAIAASMLVERTERGDEMFMVMAHRHARHALDLDAATAI